MKNKRVAANASDTGVALILVLLVFFAAGAAIGVLATLGTVFRQRREIGRLQRELRSRARETEVHPDDGGIGSLPDLSRTMEKGRHVPLLNSLKSENADRNVS